MPPIPCCAWVWPCAVAPFSSVAMKVTAHRPPPGGIPESVRVAALKVSPATTSVVPTYIFTEPRVGYRMAVGEMPGTEES